MPSTSSTSADLHLLKCIPHQDLEALQTTSRDSDTHSLSTRTHPHVKLPSSHDALCHIQTPPAYPDIRALYREAPDVPQTVQKLVMRKRTTSPYQIKLPFMADRLRARRSASGGPVVADSQPGEPKTETMREKNMTDASTSTTLTGSRAFLLDHNAQVFLPPSHCVDSSLAATRRQEARTEVVISCIEDERRPILLRPLSTLDTWSEICEDLSRAMEVFTVLSDVAPTRFLVPASQSFSADLPPPCSIQSHKLEGFPTTPASPWHSFVFPSFVVA